MPPTASTRRPRPLKPHVVRAELTDADHAKLERLQNALEQSTGIAPISKADVIRKALGDLHAKLIPDAAPDAAAATKRGS